jgi:hypothetical protein
VLLRDRLTGASKGSAFVWYTARAAGERAILQFNMRRIAEASRVQERPLVVRPADDWKLKELQESEGGGGGGGGAAAAKQNLGQGPPGAMQLEQLLQLPQGAQQLDPPGLRRAAAQPGLELQHQHQLQQHQQYQHQQQYQQPYQQPYQQHQHQPGQLVYLAPGVGGSSVQQAWVPAAMHGYSIAAGAPGMDGLVAGASGLSLGDCSGTGAGAMDHQGLLLDVLGAPGQRLVAMSEGPAQQPLYVMLQDGHLVQLAQQHQPHQRLSYY